MTLTGPLLSYQIPSIAPLGYEWVASVGPNGTVVPSLQVSNIFPNNSALNTLQGGLNPNPSLPNVTTPIAPQMIITFDTIGQIIYATLGHVRMPLRYLWVQGVNASGDVVTGDTITFAAALCAPLDPFEDGINLQIFDGSQSVFDTVNGITPPASWDPIKQALLIASLATAVIYPGTEGQDQDPTILADKGPTLVSANRGIRYIVLQDYPATSLPALSTVWSRTNPNSPGTGGKKKKPKTSLAVEFAPGAT